MGVVPWKHGFSADIETYRSRSWKKAEQQDKIRALEQRIASMEDVMAASSQTHQQEARSAANLESSPGSQRRSSVASTEHPAGGQPIVVADESEHYPVDDITMRNPASFYISRGKRSNWSRTALLKYLSNVGQFMACRFQKDMLGSWSI